MRAREIFELGFACGSVTLYLAIFVLMLIFDRKDNDGDDDDALVIDFKKFQQWHETSFAKQQELLMRMKGGAN